MKDATGNTTSYGSTRSANTPDRGRAPGQLLSLAAGLLASDLLLNLPRFLAAASAPRWAASLFAPSIDLLVVSGVLLIGAQSGDAGRRASRILAAVVIAGFDLYAGLSLFGTAPWHLLAALPAAAAVGAAGWLAAGLVVRGFQGGITRSAFLVLVALAAILQVALGNRVLAPSVVTSMARDVASLFR